MRVNVKMNEGTHVKLLFSGNLQSMGVYFFALLKIQQFLKGVEKNEWKLLTIFKNTNDKSSKTHDKSSLKRDKTL